MHGRGLSEARGTPQQSKMDERSTLAECRRLVVKIGSRALMAQADGYAVLAEQVRSQREAGRQVVVVTSGAIALGRERLGFKERPRAIDKLQAAAAAGQSLLMRAYEDAFEARGLHVAQVLLTHADVSHRERYLNARRSIDALLELGVVPIINENDVVAIDELRFGDNDQLAAMVATLVGADLLVLLTSVEGVLDDSGVRVPVVKDADEVKRYIKPSDDDVGLGGMDSKLDAAERGTRHGLPVVIARADDVDVLRKIMDGEDVGTLLMPHGSPLASRKHWIAFTLKSKGRIVVDAGAAKALVQKKSSLLPVGVTGVEGEFVTGDAVTIVDAAGTEIARGLARYGTVEIRRLAGKRTSEIDAHGLDHRGDAVVHRDDLVLVGD